VYVKVNARYISQLYQMINVSVNFAFIVRSRVTLLMVRISRFTSLQSTNNSYHTAC